MKRIFISSSEETLILTGLIVSDRFAREVQPILDLKLLKSSAARRIAKWAIDYFQEHDKPIGVHIQDRFNDAAEKEEIQKDETQIISRTLDRVSREFERADKFNIDYVLGMAEKYLSTQHVRKTIKQVDSLLDQDPVSGREMLANFQPKLLPRSRGANPFKDKELIRQAFEEVKKPLFRLPGAYGQLINDDLCRSSFMAFMGREKIGKTWNLMELAIRAAMNQCNVAFIQTGDMTMRQQTLRMSIRVAGRSNLEKYCGPRMIPTYDCEYNQFDECSMSQRTSKIGLSIPDTTTLSMIIGDEKEKKKLFREVTREGYRPCVACRKERRFAKYFKPTIWYRMQNIKPLTWREAFKHNMAFEKRMAGRELRMESFPANTITVPDIDAILANWIDNEQLLMDVVIIDYADLIAGETKEEFRHKVNNIWMGLRSLSQKYNCLLITATQADADSYNKSSVGLMNFSEDKRKYSHITSMYGLNQTEGEKVMGVTRVNPLLLRDGEYHTNNEVLLMQDYGSGRPFIGSHFKRRKQ